MTKLQGWKTVIFGAFMAIMPALLTYVGGIDWTALGIDPKLSAVIGVLIIALRSVTTTPIGKSNSVLVLLLTSTFALSACQGGARQTGIDVAQDVAVGVQRNLSDADIGRLKASCQANAPALAGAVDPAAPKMVSDIAVYPYNFCWQLLTGHLNNPDQASLEWLPPVLSMTQTAIMAAKYVLPAILPLL